jgi:TonB family protein
MRRVVMLVAMVVATASLMTAQAAQAQPPDTVPPKIMREVKPRYTPAARAEGIEGTLMLECTVLPDGTTSEGRVLKSLHHELDQEALRALADWRFLPGTKGGTRVPVSVKIEMTFTLASNGTVHRGPALDAPDVLRPGNGVSTPVLVRDVKPSYTAEALRARVQGSVKLACVVLPDGTVGDIQVLEKLDPQQDGEAVRALQQWTFKPGVKDAVAVPVRIEVEMSFALGSGPRKLREQG